MDVKSILELKNQKVFTEKRENTDILLETSNCSIKSSVRESNYYKKEAEKLSTFIKKSNFKLKQDYAKYHDYPKTSIKFYKYGRVFKIII